MWRQQTVLGTGTGKQVWQPRQAEGDVDRRAADDTGGSVGRQGTVLPEWLSMNVLMASMIPVMVITMARDVTASELRGIRFWGVISMAIIVGSITAFRYKRVARGERTGAWYGYSGSARPRKSQSARRARLPVAEIATVRSAGGENGEHVTPGEGAQVRQEMIFVTLMTIVALALGVAIAAQLPPVRSRSSRNVPCLWTAPILKYWL